MKLESSSFFDTFVRNIKKQKSFTITGLTTFSRLLLVKYIKQISGKKVLVITSTEQSALKYSIDLENVTSSYIPLYKKGTTSFVVNDREEYLKWECE